MPNAEALQPEKPTADGGEPAAGRWPARIAGGLLVAALAVQLFYFEHAPQLPGLAPGQDLHSVRVVHSEVADHPSVGGAIRLKATLVNTSPLPASLPQLQVEFLDLAGQPRVARRFGPGDYLRGPVLPDTPVAPGAKIAAQLDLVDPGLPVRSFRLTTY